MVTFTKKEKEVVKKIRAVTGIPESTIRSVFEGVIFTVLTDYVEKKPTYIPLIGEFTLKFVEDEYTKQGRVAKVDIDFEPNNFLLRNIGQVEDGEEMDLVKLLKDYIEKEMKKHIQE